jgi:type IV secretory pathway TrbL component
MVVFASSSEAPPHITLSATPRNPGLSVGLGFLFAMHAKTREVRVKLTKFRSFAMSKVVLLSVFISGAFAVAVSADPIPQAVKDACEGDFKTHCAAHTPETDAARECMAGAFEKLSDPCVEAILSSSLVEEQQKKMAQAAGAAQAPAPAPQAAEAKTTYEPIVSTKQRKRQAAWSGKKRSAAVSKARQRAAHSRRGYRKPRTVAGYIRRGTRIANFYTSRALARIFR